MPAYGTVVRQIIPTMAKLADQLDDELELRNALLQQGVTSFDGCRRHLLNMPAMTTEGSWRRGRQDSSMNEFIRRMKDEWPKLSAALQKHPARRFKVVRSALESGGASGFTAAWLHK